MVHNTRNDEQYTERKTQNTQIEGRETHHFRLLFSNENYYF